MTDPILTLTGISKSFPGVKALNEVSLELYPGQVTALIGENGAGKSTLVKTLTGIYQPDAGEIRVGGEIVSLPTAHSASAVGVTAIHQETVLFDEMTVAENIYLGHAPTNRFGMIDWRTMRAEAKETLDSMAAGIDPDIKLKELGIAKKHLVAVARALSIDARVVIMDEPTAALSQKEIEELYVLIELLKEDGKAILFISHKFDEIYRIADRFTVFRDGEQVGKGLIKDTSQSEIVQLMVGRPVEGIFPARHADIGEVVLQAKGLSHPTEFDDISFSVRKGEILGFYGLVGAGRSEVMQAVFGMTQTSSGTLELSGQTITPKSAADAVEAGIVYVPEERGKQGVITGEPIFKNVSLPSLGKTSKSGFLRMAEELALARTYTERLDLRASSLSQNVSTLSGGNQQKVVIAKWLATEPKVIILDEPTKGIDIGSKAAVHEFMAELVAQGLSVIMVSSELPEVIGMSDRIVVMREGRMVDTIENNNLKPETLVRLAAGIVEEQAA
ncbi:sugar ABC transporter ATP-binding protein [Devosia neptuniae]|jgi:rhamnose transport system ATP-binding protein|uniref:sugar ABC transporter ATP-binding protein n=1 Tax=Devosia TaxID=46913 RepID=UPI0022AED874|nr:sugar ABC transporter ATP-binding protein [Devosia neptuniae]MCZ4344803.1 sugar ABC transporter ATP-binding protein [Devosia neptuniae]|tara:strand:- start:12983 stop:14488 length:1506 start_codon:yes stop_codon:yes gene_type:complete